MRIQFFVVTGLTLIVAMTLSTAPVNGEDVPSLATIRVTAGDGDIENKPVSVAIPADLKLPPALGVRDEGDNVTSVQVEETSDGRRRLWFLVQDTLFAGQVREYELFNFVSMGGVHIDDNQQQLRFVIDEKPVLFYNQAIVPAPQNAAPYYARSGFIDPVYTPEGTRVTDGMPVGHTHQHGLMFAWTNTVYKNKKIDFWNAQAEQGMIRHERVVRTLSGPVFAEAVVHLRHLQTVKNKDIDRPDHFLVLEEEWTIRVYNVRKPHIFDLKSVQTAPGDALQIKQYHYGAMGIRGAADWTNGNGVIRTNEGLDRVKGNHTRPAWVYMGGPKDDITAGMLVMSSPDNFRSPQPVRLHPEMPYFCFAPHILGDMEIDDTPYESHFRFIVDDGEISKEQGDAYHATYATPVKVEFELAEQSK